LFAMILCLGTVLATIDLNLPELEYVADHLKKSDCRKLVAALHDPNFDIISNINAAGKNWEIWSILLNEVYLNTTFLSKNISLPKVH